VSAVKKRCLIQGCPNHGTWESGFCPTCRAYLKRVEGLSVAWRLARQEVVTRWGVRLELALSRKGTVVHLASHRRRASRGKA
jgi:hypothetical protein